MLKAPVRGFDRRGRRVWKLWLGLLAPGLFLTLARDRCCYRKSPLSPLTQVVVNNIRVYIAAFVRPAGLSSDLYPPRSIEGKTRTKLCQKRPQGTGLRSSPELRPV